MQNNTLINFHLFTGKSVVPKKLQTDSQDVCKRLEKKIQSLSKMGNQLQHDNKGIVASKLRTLMQLNLKMTKPKGFTEFMMG